MMRKKPKREKSWQRNDENKYFQLKAKSQLSIQEKLRVTTNRSAVLLSQRKRNPNDVSWNWTRRNSSLKEWCKSLYSFVVKIVRNEIKVNKDEHRHSIVKIVAIHKTAVKLEYLSKLWSLVSLSAFFTTFLSKSWPEWPCLSTVYLFLEYQPTRIDTFVNYKKGLRFNEDIQ